MKTKKNEQKGKKTIIKQPPSPNKQSKTKQNETKKTPKTRRNVKRKEQHKQVKNKEKYMWEMTELKIKNTHLILHRFLNKIPLITNK